MKWLKKIWERIKGWFKPDDKDKDKFDYSKLDWCYGGQRPYGPVEDTTYDGFRIESASADNKGIRFRGEGRMWGYTHNEAKARNCIFFEEGGVYHGGFWEWGSPDRTYRGFENIYSGYKGWNAQRFLKSKKWLFFIMTDGGSKRSNGIFIDR